MNYIEFFSTRFPSKIDIIDLCNHLELASERESDAFTDLLSRSFELETKRLPIWCDRVLLNSESSKLLELTIIAAKRSELFDSLQLSDLFDACLKFYSSGIIGVDVLEAHWSGLIDSMNVHSKTSYGNPFYAIGRGLSLVTDSSLKSVFMPKLDESLSRHAANYDSCFYDDSVIKPVSWMAHSLNIPSTFKTVAGFYQYKKDPAGVMLLLEEVTKKGQITPDQLKSVAEIYGLGQLGESYLRVISYQPKLENIYPFIETFGEHVLFSDKGLEKLKKEVSIKRSLAIYDIISQEDFDPEKFPRFIEFVLGSSRAIYNTFTMNDGRRRESVRRLNIDFGKHAEVWSYELDYYRRHIDSCNQKLQVNDSPGILYELKKKRPQEYRNALNAINEIGLHHIGKDLAGASIDFVTDFLSQVELNHREKREFMKLFPISKSLILEDDLGM